eukprot:snap_masked-scaffold_4-processed-gene-3.45-mRNA-1 protein AED:1.00 eAED:1.00 QI:0/-1/0/0/-1/1/1/0/395
MDLDDLEELVNFTSNKRADVRALACQNLLSLTSTEENVNFLLLFKEKLIKTLLTRIGDQTSVSSPAIKTLINLSTNEDARNVILSRKTIFKNIFDSIFSILEISPSKTTQVTLQQADLEYLNSSNKLLRNLSLEEQAALDLLHGRFTDTDEFLGNDLLNLVELLLALPKEIKVDSADITHVLVNVSQCPKGQEILSSGRGIKTLDKILVAQEVTNSLFFKTEMKKNFLDQFYASLCLLKNMCFDEENHELIFLDEKLISKIICGILVLEGDDFESLSEVKDTSIEFPEELYDDIDFLERTDEKLGFFMNVTFSEVDSDLRTSCRHVVIDIILLLTKSKFGRQKLREINAYEIIKRYHPKEDEESISEIVFTIVERLLAEEDTAPQINQEITYEVD